MHDGMIKVEILKGINGFIRKFTVEGHSDYAEYGSDIVCSAVSVLTQTAIIGLRKVAGVSIIYVMKDGLIDCEIPFIGEKDKLIKANAILDTMVMGLMNIKRNYSDYINVVIKGEV